MHTAKHQAHHGEWGNDFEALQDISGTADRTGGWRMEARRQTVRERRRPLEATRRQQQREAGAVERGKCDYTSVWPSPFFSSCVRKKVVGLWRTCKRTSRMRCNALRSRGGGTVCKGRWYTVQFAQRVYGCINPVLVCVSFRVCVQTTAVSLQGCCTPLAYLLLLLLLHVPVPFYVQLWRQKRVGGWGGNSTNKTHGWRQSVTDTQGYQVLLYHHTRTTARVEIKGTIGIHTKQEGERQRS